jgi:hypothetical protein
VLVFVLDRRRRFRRRGVLMLRGGFLRGSVSSEKNG